MTTGKVIVMIFLSLLFVGCYYDKKEVVYPDPVSSSNCDTSAVRYTAHVTPILQLRCNGCHGGNDLNVTNAGGGYRLDTYAGLTALVPNQKLINSITHVGLYPMPKGGGKLSNCEIGTIRTWIRNGFPNN